MYGSKCLKTKTGVTVLILSAPFAVIISHGCEACSTTRKVIFLGKRRNKCIN